MSCETPSGAIEETLCDIQRQDAVELAIQAALLEEQSQVRTETHTQLQEEREAGEKISSTVRLIGIEEWSFLISFFSIPGQSVLAVDRIEEIQASLGFTGDAIDGVIGSNTLRRIYEQIYSQNLSQLGNLQQTRWEIYTQMRDYPPKTRWVSHLNQSVTLHPSSIPDVFNKDYYFGELSGEPLQGTGINAEILPHLNQTIQRQDTVAYMLEVNNRYVLAAYRGGELVFASYASPGNPNHSDGQGMATPEGSWAAQRDGQFSDRYWISGADASVRSSGGRYISDIMPYAVNIEGGIFSHAGRVNGEQRSHGCIRLPLHYAHALHTIFEASGRRMAWEITTS